MNSAEVPLQVAAGSERRQCARGYGSLLPVGAAVMGIMIEE